MSDQLVVGLWHHAQYPEITSVQQALGLAEETGEVCRCVLKRSQGIRKNTDWSNELRKELVDVYITLLALSELNNIELHEEFMKEFPGVVERAKQKANEQAQFTS